MSAIQAGNIGTVQRIVADTPELVTGPLGGPFKTRTALHVVADWPGYFPNGPQVVRLLVAAGADPNARNPGDESPLHWAASSDDADVAAALIDAGGDIEAPDGSIGTPLDNAIGYACWHVADLLAARGARVDKLWHAAADLDQERIDRETWIKRIAARRSYRIMPKENPDSDGYQRMMCPAEAGKAQCPIKPHTVGRGIHLPLVDPEPNPTGPLRVCRQRTITISPEAGAKHWQALEYGGAEWQKVYFRLRNSVEGYNGYAKNPLAEGIESAGSRRIRGIAAQTILLAFQLAHANRRKIKKWLDTLALNSERPRRRTHHRRKTKEPRSWTPTGYLVPAA
ncbi:ankyrin repeat domain-containing protein [Streptomyces sp. NPDC004096]